MKKITTLLLVVLLANQVFGQIYKVSKSSIKFKSDAPLELIQANSTKVTGLLNTSTRSFAFSVPMESFEGFNSALQRTHFNENYIESAKFPNATFEGKIIEDIDFTQQGKYDVRGKGKFTIHGVEQVRIIKTTINVLSDKIEINSTFTVLLVDHEIKIPTVVNQKIAKEISVEFSATMNAKN